MALRVGIVGAGGISRQHASSWKALGAEVSVYALDGAERLAREFDLMAVGSMTDLLERVDVVDVCTTTTTHCLVARQAVAAGVDVVCEKPLGSSFAEALALARAAREAGVRVLPAHVVRYFPQYERAHNAVVDGLIGRPAVLRFVRGGSGPTREWFFDDSLSGGVITDLMIHDLDQARWLAGEVASVYAVQSPPNDGDRVPRAVTTHVTLSHASGAISHAVGFWGPPGMSFGPSFDIAGDRGRVWTSPEAMTTVFEDLPQGSEGVLEGAEENPFLTELRDMRDALITGMPARVDVMDGVAAVAVCAAARDSVRAARPVPFEPYMALMAEADVQ